MLHNFVLAILLLGAAAANAAQPTLLIVGDSLSAGFGIAKEASWVTLLEKRLAREGYGYRIVNASISGDTTQGGLERLPRALELHAPGLVLIELGGNDGLRGFPLALLRRNLAAMIEMSRDAGARVVLAGMQLPPNYGPEYTRGFRDVYRRLAEQHGVALVPFLLEDVALDRRLMQADGIHPNEAAQEKLLDNIWPVLEPELAALEDDPRQVAGR
ncbi:MAG TPA: arylesterase [Gammaproteobacteria bacterium]|nr:arylesterase [Gammaproteobacteria bacterium]